MRGDCLSVVNKANLFLVIEDKSLVRFLSVSIHCRIQICVSFLGAVVALKCCDFRHLLHSAEFDNILQC